MTKKKCEVLVAGNPRWARVISSELAAMNVSSGLHVGLHQALRGAQPGAIGRFLSARILHWVSGVTEKKALFTLAKRLNKKIVMHWIGTDVVNLRDYRTRFKSLPQYISEMVDVNLSDSPGLQEELCQLGVRSEVIRLLPMAVDAEVQPLPDEPAVLAYFSDESRAEFYGCSFIMSLASHFPDIPFYVVGSERGAIANVPDNVTFLGEVEDMESMYEKTSVFVRFIEHDSLSAMVLEALARGRYVLYSHSFPHTTMLRGIEDAVAAMKKACSAREPNHAGAAYVRESFSWRKEVEKLRGIYGRLLSRDTRPVAADESER
jgi:hypothetical protein